MTTVWNSADKTSGMTLSAGDTIATATSSTDIHQGVRATTSKDSTLGGKFVIGFRNVLFRPAGGTDAFDWIGIILGTADLVVADGALKQIIQTYEGKSYTGTGSTSFQHNDFSAITGTVDIDLAIDFDNMLYWVRVSNQNSNAWSNSGDPATATGGNAIAASGVYYPSTRLTDGLSLVETCTIEPAPSGLPSGFSGWDAASGDANASGVTITATSSLVLSDAFATGTLQTIDVTMTAGTSGILSSNVVQCVVVVTGR